VDEEQFLFNVMADARGKYKGVLDFGQDKRHRKKLEKYLFEHV
jgi:hypothetical protein